MTETARCGAASNAMRPSFHTATIREIGGTLATRLLLFAIQLPISILVARLLGPDGRGSLAFAVTLAALVAQFSNLGLHSANTYFAARRAKYTSWLLGNSLLVSVVLGAAAIVVLATLAAISPSVIPLDSSLLWVAMLAIPVGLAYILLQRILVGRSDFKNYNAGLLLDKLVVVVLVTAMFTIGRGGPALVLGAMIVGQVAGLAWVYRALVRNHRTSPKASVKLFCKAAGYGIRAYAASLSAFLVLRLDILMIKYLSPAENADSATGLYSVAAGLGDLLYMLPVVVCTVVFPKLSEMKNSLEQRRLTSTTTVWVAGLMIAICGLAGILAPTVIGLLYGTDFVGATTAFRILLPGICMLSVNTILMNYFASIGMPHVAVWSPFLACVANVAMNLYAIAHFGIAGAALSSAVCYGIMLVISLTYYWMTTKDTRVEPC